MTLDLNLGSSPLAMDTTGTVRIGGSRVTLDTIVSYFKQGESAEEIHYGFPTVELADIYLTIAYYLRHQPEVDAYLERRDREAEAIRKEIEARQDTQAFRERILARQAQKAQTK